MTVNYVNVASLRPDTAGHDLRLVVVESPSDQNGKIGSRIAEGVVGDETGVISFTARNEQVDVLEVGRSIEITNGRVEMFKGSMRLGVPATGSVQQLSKPLGIKPNVENNLSLIEFELVPLQQPLPADRSTAPGTKAVPES